ncbi:hypothetical protein WA158_003521 [Blastocystis sp. Blastoise]
MERNEINANTSDDALDSTNLNNADNSEKEFAEEDTIVNDEEEYQERKQTRHQRSIKYFTQIHMIQSLGTSNLQNEEFTFFNDRQKCLINTVSSLFPLSSHLFCPFHLIQNLKKFRDNSYLLIKDMCLASNIDEYFSKENLQFYEENYVLHKPLYLVSNVGRQAIYSYGCLLEILSKLKSYSKRKLEVIDKTWKIL